MARGRMINRSVATDQAVEQFAREHGPNALAFHHRLIAFLDVNGNVRADPYWLKAEIMPLRAGVSPSDCARWAKGLQEYRLAIVYEEQGLPYLHFPRFRANQKNLRADRERPKYPVPDGFDEELGYVPDAFRKASGEFPVEVEVEVEEEGEEHESVVQTGTSVQLDLSGQPSSNGRRALENAVTEVFDLCRNLQRKRTGGPPIERKDRRLSKIRARLREAVNHFGSLEEAKRYLKTAARGFYADGWSGRDKYLEIEKYLFDTETRVWKWFREGRKDELGVSDADERLFNRMAEILGEGA